MSEAVQGVERNDSRRLSKVSLKIPELALLDVGHGLGAGHVGMRWVGEGRVVEDGEGFADGGIPGLAAGDVDGRADPDEVEDLLGGFEGHPDAAMGAGVGFQESPVHAVGGAVELDPEGYRVAGVRAALAAAGGDLVADPEVAFRGGCRGGADPDRGGEEDLVAFHDIESLGSGAELDGNVGAVGGLGDRRVEVEGVAGAIARRGAGAEGESEKGEGEAGGEALEARFHRYY